MNPNIRVEDRKTPPKGKYISERGKTIYRFVNT
jgi:hypothetical protein